jgi:hypothetical protein
MLRLANESLDAIKGDCALASAFEIKDQQWIAHPIKGEHMILFNFVGGILTMSMGESEHDLSEGLQIIAYEDANERLFCTTKITFKQILDLLNWTCDDYLD